MERVPRIRAARAIAEYFREQDAGTMVTENMIRQMMKRGDVPTFRNGNKVLTSIEAVEAFITRALNEEGC